MLEPPCLPYWIDQDSNFDNSTENGTLSQTTDIYVQTAAYVSIILPLIFIMMMFAVICVLLKLKKHTPKNGKCFLKKEQSLIITIFLTKESI